MITYILRITETKERLGNETNYIFNRDGTGDPGGAKDPGSVGGEAIGNFR